MVPCPNCGKPLSIDFDTQTRCPSCGEALALIAPNKIGLVKLISTYRGLADANPESLSSPIPISQRRREISAEFARDRFVEQEKAGARALVSSILLTAFGVVFFGGSLIRILLAPSDPLSLIGMCVGLILAPLGASMAILTWRAIRVWRQEEEESLTQEMFSPNRSDGDAPGGR